MRQTYPQRFEKVLSNPNITTRDKNFVQDIQKFYNKKSRLSSGQSKWFSKIEEKLINIESGCKGDLQLNKELLKLKKLVQNNEFCRNFVESLTEQNNLGKQLSTKQLEVFAKIKNQYSEEAVEESKRWRDEYDDEKRKIAKICAEYYNRMGYYFKDLSHKILNQEDFIPSKKQWDKLTQNKYAQKVLKSSHLHESKYKVSETVYMRKTSQMYRAEFDKTPGFIVKENVCPPEAVNGGRFYSVLFAGRSKTVNVAEKDLKKSK